MLLVHLHLVGAFSCAGGSFWFDLWWRRRPPKRRTAFLALAARRRALPRQWGMSKYTRRSKNVGGGPTAQHVQPPWAGAGLTRHAFVLPPAHEIVILPVVAGLNKYISMLPWEMANLTHRMRLWMFPSLMASLANSVALDEFPTRSASTLPRAS